MKYFLIILILINACIHIKAEKVSDDLEIIDNDKELEVNSSEATCSYNKNGEKTCGGDIKTNENIEQKNGDGYSPTKHSKKVKKDIETPSIYNGTLKYEDLFAKKGHERDEYLQSFGQGENYTEYYDVSLDAEEIAHIKKVKMAIYPSIKFKFNSQGNFLNFYKTMYGKGLPVYFTTDSMLHAFTENVSRVMQHFFENVFIFVLKSFLHKLIEGAEKIKETIEGAPHTIALSHAEIYYGTALDILIDGFENYEFPKDIQPAIKGASTLSKYYVTNDFFVMMKKRKINTEYMRPSGFWLNTRKLHNLCITMKYFQLFRFDTRDDLKAIIILGKLIHDSGLINIFNELRSMNHYLVGEDRNTPNILEIYQLSKELGIDTYDITNEQRDKIYKQIEKVVEGRQYSPDIPLTNDYILFSQEALDKFRYEREFTTYLFNYPYDLEDWVKNKLIDYSQQKMRLVCTSYELVDAMHHASAYREMIFAHYKGEQVYEGDQILKYRDAVDMKENFEKAKYSIKHSMEKNPQIWKLSIPNYFHYILYKATRGLKKNKDPVYKTMTWKEKNFFTAYGAYTHFKKEFTLLSSSGAAKGIEGNIPELFLEPNLDFYKELSSFWSGFKERIYQYLITSQNFLKINYKMIIAEYNNIFLDLSDAIDICIRGIELQESGKLDDEFRDTLRKLIYYDDDLKMWQGWFTRVHQQKNLFNLDINMAKVMAFAPNESLKFPGAVLYNTLRFPFISLIVVQDPHEKVEKLFIMSTYSAKDVYKKFAKSIKFEDTRKMVIDRE